LIGSRDAEWYSIVCAVLDLIAGWTPFSVSRKVL
jgi:hypothetical protein